PPVSPEQGTENSPGSAEKKRQERAPLLPVAGRVLAELEDCLDTGVAEELGVDRRVAARQALDDGTTELLEEIGGEGADVRRQGRLAHGQSLRRVTLSEMEP